MRSGLIVKENSLLNPADYPKEPQQLVEDFNRRIMDSAGIITGLGKEYHTIWLVDSKDLSMRLYRSTGENTSRGAVELGYKFNHFDKYISAYVDVYVADRYESVLRDASSEVVLDRIRDGSLYTVDYIRMSDEGELTYHQMAFALAGEPGEADRFILAFKDVDRSIRKHIADKKYLREQLDIVAALSRDYYNIFKVDINNGTVVILKLDGYVTKGMDQPSEKVYPYDVLCNQYITDRVYPEDQPAMFKAMSFETVREKMREVDEYVSSYRVLDNGEIHYYQFTYIPINPDNPDSGILAGFKNVDDVVESAREREALELLAETDIMTGILNHGSGERKIKDALANGKYGMFCIMDIDDFKMINDEYGHDVGDKVIRGIADIIRTEFRGLDIVFRLGGDEYAVFVNNVRKKTEGRAAIDRIFSKIAKMNIEELNGKEVSVSVGAIITTAGEKADFEDIYKKADGCVYESKTQQGCAVTFYSGKK
ncbi:MAG: GGDEF domain-containing protein [Lachnospiraceae bacterium]|nr:GGDEF domain-containing protein [Lachnospiraceae bacterium]